MTRARLTPAKTLAKRPQALPQTAEEKRIEAERLRDVHLLLERLVEREEMTVKMILDCLYDIGYVNLINKKFPTRPLNPIMKYIARLSKPAFKIFALRWFKKNSPQLLTAWLSNKVKF